MARVASAADSETMAALLDALKGQQPRGTKADATGRKERERVSEGGLSGSGDGTLTIFVLDCN